MRIKYIYINMRKLALYIYLYVHFVNKKKNRDLLENNISMLYTICIYAVLYLL